MKTKIIPVLLQALVSFVILTALSYFMNQWINGSQQLFSEYFQERWPVLLALVVFYTAYKVFLNNRKVK